MRHHDRPLRLDISPVRLGRRSRPLPEFLESRRLLATGVASLAPAITLVTAAPVAAPVPGLASGIGIAGATQASPAIPVSVAPSSASLAAPSAPSIPTDSPSVTLSSLPTESETANAPASEVARPTPGRTDRIATTPLAPDLIPLTHLRSPGSDDELLPEPEKPPEDVAPPAAPKPQPVPQLEAPPAPAPAPREQAPEPKPAPILEPVPTTIEPVLSLGTWDAAIESAAAEAPPTITASTAWRAEAAMAAGLVMAFWNHRRFQTKAAGRRSRERSMSFQELEAGPRGS